MSNDVITSFRHRILRPGGLFIIREHDLDFLSAQNNDKAVRGTRNESSFFGFLTLLKYLMPMLDCAHMVFNAGMIDKHVERQRATYSVTFLGTGVSIAAEKDEIRAFRSNLQWRQILEEVSTR